MEIKRPLIVMTPKSLLRLPQATSKLSQLTTGTFEYVLDDPSPAGAREEVTRLVLCSGKIYYDVITSEERARAKHVAFGRVEILYPFPQALVGELIGSYPNLREVVWLQEEPRNFGPRKFVLPLIAEMAPDKSLHSISRPERSSPAEGYPAAHRAEQARLVREALETVSSE